VSFGIKVQESRCAGCANCIQSCPTEAMRVIDGCVTIIEDLCIDCGECMRKCPHKAIVMNEDDWELIHSQEKVVLASDPVFYVQMNAYSSQSLIREALASWHVWDITEYMGLAFDLTAYSLANILENEDHQNLPLISTYCPAVLRLIETNFPELIGRIAPVDSPLEVGVAIWREVTGNTDSVTLLAPCPAKITLVHNPEGRESSNMQFTVSVGKLVRALLAGGPKVHASFPKVSNNRWLEWAIVGGESAHISNFSERKLSTISVSGMRNTMDLLKEMELGRLRGVDYIECRSCDLGCIGGIGNAESRFLSKMRLDHSKTNWDVGEEQLRTIKEWYKTDIWKLKKELKPSQRAPLSEDLNEAMVKLKEMNRIYSELPQINCGSCGRPSCRALAEDIIRGQGEVNDCIFKIRENIQELGKEIVELSDRMPHTLKRKGS